MKLSRICTLLNCECLTGEELLDIEVHQAFGSDLMSDVLAFSSENTLLLTGVTNPQVIRTAEMLDISAIIFVRGKIPSIETLDLAKKNNMILLSYNDIMYKCCGILYNSGLNGVDIKRRRGNNG